MGKWGDEIMGTRVNDIMRKRDNKRMGRQENGRIRGDFIYFMTFSAIAFESDPFS